MATPKSIEDYFMSSGKDIYCLVRNFSIPPLSSSLHYSNAIFEGMSIIAKRRKHGYDLGFFHPVLNYERMHFGMEFFDYNISHYNTEHLIANVFQVCCLNNWHEKIELEGKKLEINTNNGSFVRIYVRPIAYSTNNVIGLGAAMNFDILQALMPMGTYLEKPDGKGLNVMLFPYPRELAFPHIKASSNYQLSIYARKKLREYNVRNKKKCNEMIFTNDRGKITEGSGENVFLLREDEIVTPPVSEGVLPGITMRIVGKIAKAMGLRFRYSAFTINDIKNADGLFFTGNAAGVVSIGTIIKVDREYRFKGTYEVKKGLRSKTARKIVEEYEKVQLGDESYGKLFTYLHEWIDDNEIDKLAESGGRIRKNRGNSCAALKTMPNPPTNWEKEKKALLDEFGIKRFL